MAPSLAAAIKKHEYEQRYGSSSAENKGGDRNGQSALHTGLDNETKKNFAKEAGAGKKDLSELFLSGSRSGRDEYSGARMKVWRTPGSVPTGNLLRDRVYGGRPSKNKGCVQASL